MQCLNNRLKFPFSCKTLRLQNTTHYSQKWITTISDYTPGRGKVVPRNVNNYVIN